MDLSELRSVIKGKKVHLAMDWDADGLSSGALIYHLTKDIVDIDYSCAREQEIPDDADIFIFIDRKPADNIPPEKVILIDHHVRAKKEYLLQLIESKQSTSLVIFENFISDTKNPYLIFLTLLGYFGDDGPREEIPKKLFDAANTLFPKLMEKEGSRDHWRYKLERYTATLNVGKRTQWSGELPFELLKSITEHEPFTKKTHTLAQQLETLRATLQHVNTMDVKLERIGDVHYGEIDNQLNIQGWLCKKELHNTPIIIINTSREPASGSIRVPETNSWNAATFLEKLQEKIPSLISGGHPRAAGFTLAKTDIKKLKQELTLLSS